jgi:hypothetical protein
MAHKKFTFLLPVLGNDGQPYPTSDWDWLQTELVVRYGGWSLDGKVEGAWRDAESGHVYRDVSYRYIVVVEEPAVPALFSFLGEVKSRFNQLALLVEAPLTEVTFL